MALELFEIGIVILAAISRYMSKAAGYYVAIGAEHTARAEEQLITADMLGLQIVHYGHRMISETIFELESPVDIEDAFIRDTHLLDLTKMAISRQLQLRDNFDVNERARRWGLKKEALMLDFAGPDAVAALRRRAAPPPLPA